MHLMGATVHAPRHRDKGLVGLGGLVVLDALGGTPEQMRFDGDNGAHALPLASRWIRR